MNRKRRNKRIGLVVLVLLILFFVIPVPQPLFDDPYSTVLEANQGELLSARIAQDGQWRFPEGSEVPEKFATCIRMFEDEYFYYHPGINPVSLLRAAKQNWKANRVVSGGSTLTMQVIRLARKGKPRTIGQKLIELFWSLRIEARYSKEEILQLYAAHAPFGGNVVGLEAASWRYYNRPSDQLSWAESATLAVLPNAPSLIYPGKNQELLLKKRNILLKKLYSNEIIDSTTAELAMSENLPIKPHKLPQDAIHLLNRSISEGKNEQRLQTTIDKDLQIRTNELLNQHYLQLKQNEIHNAAVLILDNQKNEVIAYVGNTNGTSNKHGHRVDIIKSQRSTGSILKPILYGLAWQEGLITPNSLLPDIPTQFGGYTPKNFNKEYDGAVPAADALVRSLNVPAVRLLKDYGVERFYDDLKEFPIPSINLGANHYGLSIILGGAEASLWEMCTAYKGLSQSLEQIEERDYQYAFSDFDFPKWELNAPIPEEKLSESSKIQAATIWHLVENLKELNRPGQEEGWESYVGRQKIAWKTGTSFGLRDAWAIGVCPEYTIGVWVGNADGEGRPGLTGISAAAPILFETFDLLGETTWYTEPYDEMYSIEICEQSGYRKSLNCELIDTLFANKEASRVKICPYHEKVQLDKTEQFRVNSSCYAIADMKQKTYMVLPPLMQWYYRKKNPSYRLIPEWKESCKIQAQNPMQLISPEKADQVLIPIELGGEKGRLVIEVAHSNPNATIYWHIDSEYLGQSSGRHNKEINPQLGKHILTLVDSKGNTLIKEIEIIE